MSDWINDARRLRNDGMSVKAISEQLGIPTHRLHYALSEQCREKTYKRVLFQRAVLRARRAFGVEARL